MTTKLLTKEEFNKAIITTKGRYKQLIEEAIEKLKKDPHAVVELFSNDTRPLMGQGIRYTLPKEYECIIRKGRIFILKR